MTNLNFNKIETGEFSFHSFEQNPVIMGFFIGIENEEGTGRVHDEKTFKAVDLSGKGCQGVIFKEYETNEIKVVSSYYNIVKVLSEIECNLDKTVFRIEFKGKKKSGAGEVSLFDIQKAEIE
jgi:hypothetical protein